MPKTKLKPLYIGKSISDLEVLYNFDEFIKGNKAMMLSNLAKNLLDTAKQCRRSGDEELNYIHYMLYLTVVTVIQKSHEYQEKKDYLNNMLGSLNVKSAEKLANSLEQR